MQRKVVVLRHWLGLSARPRASSGSPRGPSRATARAGSRG